MPAASRATRFRLFFISLLRELVSQIEYFTTVKIFQFKGILFGILVIAFYSFFLLAGFDFYYDISIILEIVLTIYYGYLILLHDCEQLYTYYAVTNKAYNTPKPEINIRKILDENLKQESYPYKYLFACFIFILTVEFILFLFVDANIDIKKPNIHWLYDIIPLFWLYLANGIKQNHLLLHKLLHFAAALSVMLFTTCIISNLSFQRLINLIDIIKKEHREK